jgi:hypothetical protein
MAHKRDPACGAPPLLHGHSGRIGSVKLAAKAKASVTVGKDVGKLFADTFNLAKKPHFCLDVEVCV